MGSVGQSGIVWGSLGQSGQSGAVLTLYVALGQLSPGAVVTWAVVALGQLSPWGSCPLRQLSPGQLLPGHLSPGELSAHRHLDTLNV